MAEEQTKEGTLLSTSRCPPQIKEAAGPKVQSTQELKTTDQQQHHNFAYWVLEMYRNYPEFIEKLIRHISPRWLRQ